MRIDDSFDAELTEAGVKQATDCGARDDVKLRGREIECVVSSPLTRCLHTGGLVFPDAMRNEDVPKLVFEDLREVNGWLVNAKRRRREAARSEATSWECVNSVCYSAALLALV